METDATFTYLLLKNWGQSRPSPRFRPANYVYDAENRLIAAGGMSYVYDGDGKRVKKCTEGSTAGICATGATGTLYWGVPGSETLAETDLAGNVLENYIYFNGQRIARREPTSPPTIHFYFSDHLGTHSLITDLNGTMPPQEESDYFPYGGEIPISGGDSNHYKFTGKERDSESGLDNFGARFFTSNIGRFMTPDWAARPTTVPYAVFGDPQSLNLYGYVRNDPVSSADADGHGCFEGNRDNPGNCSGDLMNAFVNDLAGLGSATHDIYDDTDTWSMLEEMATPSAQNNGNARTREFSTTNGAVSVADGKAAYSAAVDYLRTSSTMKGVVDKFENGSMPVVFINDGNDRVQGGKLYWDPHSALNTTSGGKQSPALGLGHEMTHATGRTLGTIIRSMISDPHYDNREERRVIERFEMPAARQLGEGTRTDHSCGSPCTYWVQSPAQF
jgi:RHS repeat-associated protein